MSTTRLDTIQRKLTAIVSFLGANEAEFLNEYRTTILPLLRELDEDGARLDALERLAGAIPVEVDAFLIQDPHRRVFLTQYLPDGDAEPCPTCLVARTQAHRAGQGDTIRKALDEVRQKLQLHDIPSTP